MAINIIRLQDTTTFTKSIGYYDTLYSKETIEVLYTVPAGKRAKVILEELSGPAENPQWDMPYYDSIVNTLSIFNGTFLNSIGLGIQHSHNSNSAKAIAGLVVGNKTVLTNGRVLKRDRVTESTGNLCFKTPDGKHYLTVYDTTTEVSQSNPTYSYIDRAVIGKALYEVNNPNSAASNLEWYKTLVGWLKTGQTTPKEHILTEGETIEYAFLYQNALRYARFYASVNLTIIEEDI